MPAVTVTSRIPAIVAELPARSKVLANEIAQGTAGRAEGRAPVATGTLRDSIEAKPIQGGAAVYAVWYWFLVEFGTVHQPANPFMIPALEEARAAVFTAARRTYAEL